MSISEISLYNILRKKIGEEETTELMQFVKSEVRSEVDTKTSVFMTKDDKVELIDWINRDKIELIDRINKSKTETIAWIVGIGVLQFILSILSKKFL
jgi:hypothetical protein